MKLSLSLDQLIALTAPVNGRGGFQTLLRKLRQNIESVTVDISLAEFDTLRRAATTGRGGFQNRAQALLGMRPTRKRRTR